MAVPRRHAMTLEQLEKVSPYQSNTVWETFFPVRADPTRVGAQVQSGPRNDRTNPFALIDHEESENSEGSIASANAEYLAAYRDSVRAILPGASFPSAPG